MKRKARVLIVDDEKSARDTLEAQLYPEGYDLVFLETGREVLNKINQIDPDIILLDVMMPGMDGFEVCEKLKSNPDWKYVPVILITALDTEDDLVRGLDAGADDFLTKPVRRAELMARVRSMLRIKVRYDELRGKPEAAKEKIKTLLIDDSPIALTILKRMVNTSPEIEVVGTAFNGKKALEMLPQINPDVICTDVEMPVMDGFEFTEEVMKKYPRPILVVSSIVQEEHSENIFRLLEAGALDIFPKPRGGLSLQGEYKSSAKKLVEKIKAVSQADFSKKTMPKKRVKSKSLEVSAKSVATKIKMVSFGASVGGIQALKSILTQFPSNFPVPIVCIQRIEQSFLKNLVNWLARNCNMRVQMAQEGEIPTAGTIYFPNEDSHLEFDSRGRFTSQRKASFMGYRPSITVTFNSMVEQFKDGTIAVLLSGMGTDGIEGLKRVSKNGGVTIVQSKESSLVTGMIEKAIDSGYAKYVLDMEEIPGKIIEIIEEK